VVLAMDICERLRRYVANFNESLKSLKILDAGSKSLVDVALAYYNDSRYYLEKGDCVTGLITISYAEGILDALRSLELIEWSWVKAKEVRVFAAGSFDIIHPGHVEFLKWSSSLGNKLYVVVSRDSSYVRTKGFEPIFKDIDRALIVESIRYVYKAYVGSEDFLKPVEELKPDIIALGPDQIDAEELKRLLKDRGVSAEVIKMSNRISNYSSSSIKEKICSSWCKNKYNIFHPC
jgi:FAD synthetase